MVEAFRVAFFGTPRFAVPTLQKLLDSRHTVCGVVTQPDRPRGRGHQVSDSPVKALAVERGLPLLQPTRLKDPAFAAALRDWRADIGVVAAYGKILPDDILALPPRGMINVHASLLPLYRGAAPVHRAVIAGDAITGVTIMRVVTELDAGPMLDSVTVPVGPDDTSVDVERALATAGARLLVDVADRMARGPVAETAQDHARATYAPKLLKTESPIDWSLPAPVIHNRVRGLQPWPMASSTLDGVRVLIHRTAVAESRSDDAPGTVIESRGDVLAAAAGDGSVVRILEIQPEGRRVMHAREFLSGRTLAPGVAFGPP